MRKFIRDLNANGNGLIRMYIAEAVKLNVILAGVALVAVIAWVWL